MKDIFEKMPNPEEAVKTLQSYGIFKSVFNIGKDNTLIILDEIQISKRTYSLLKSLTLMNRFRIIASGFLLGINLGCDYLDPGPTVLNVLK